MRSGSFLSCRILPKSVLGMYNMTWLSYFHPLNVLQRKRIANVAQDDIPDFLKENLNYDYPKRQDEAKRQEYICVDLETTGFDPVTDKILSIGWVIIRDLKIDLSSSVHFLINEEVEISATTAVINHITPEMLQQGVLLDEAIREFFYQCRGRVIVAHGCVMEQCFIEYYLKTKYQLKPLPLLWLDTLSIEKHLNRMLDREGNTDYRLSSARTRYGLPEYNAHSALIDAISTAELLLAQIKVIYKEKKSCFGRLYRISHSQK